MHDCNQVNAVLEFFVNIPIRKAVDSRSTNWFLNKREAIRLCNDGIFNSLKRLQKVVRQLRLFTFISFGNGRKFNVSLAMKHDGFHSIAA